MKHAEKHPTLDVEGCFGCHAAGVAGFTYAGGREVFHNEPSLREREKQAVLANTAKHGKDGFSRADG